MTRTLACKETAALCTAGAGAIENDGYNRVVSTGNATVDYFDDIIRH